MARAIGEHEAEHKIGHQPDVMPGAAIRERHPERKRIALAEGLIGKGGNHLGRMDEPNAGASLRRPLQRHVKIDDLKLVLDEGAAGFAVLAAPFDIGEIDAVALDQEAGAAVGERIGHRCRAGGRVVVELRARAVDIAGMKEPRQPIIGAVERAADQGGDVGRAQEAMPRQLPHDFHVVIGEAEGRRLRRTAEPRPAGRCDKRLQVHGAIIPRAKRGQSCTRRHMGKAPECLVQPGRVGTGRDRSGLRI